jgi:hypothetical protein
VTREEILAMVPGRELDAYVAKYVRFPSHSHPIEEVKAWCQKYSTDISAAMEVVNVLNRRGYNVNLYFTPLLNIAYVSTVTGLMKSEVSADTAPVAICKAALLAVMEVNNQ